MKSVTLISPWHHRIFFCPLSIHSLTLSHSHSFRLSSEPPNLAHLSLKAPSPHTITMATHQCDLCKHICKDAGGLKSHSRDYHDGEAGRITALPCPRPNCNSRNMTRSGYRRHLKTHAVKDIQELGYALDEQTLTADELADFGPVREVETNVEEEDEEEGQVDMCPFCGKELPSLITLANHLVHHLRQRTEALIRMDQHTIEEDMDVVEIIEIIPGIRYDAYKDYDITTTPPPPSHGYQENSCQQNGCEQSGNSSWNTRAIQEFEAEVAQLSQDVEQEDQRTTQARAKEDLIRVTGSANTAEFVLSFLEPVESTDFEDKEERVLLRIKRPGEVSRICGV